MVAETRTAIKELMKTTLLTLASTLAPFLGKNEQWAESYVKTVEENATLLKQRYGEAVKFAQSAKFLLAEPEPNEPEPNNK